MKIYSILEDKTYVKAKRNFKSISKRDDITSRYAAMVSYSKSELKFKTLLLVYIDFYKLIKVLFSEAYETYLIKISELIVNFLSIKRI